MTPYDNIIDRFIRKIKNDKEYFCVNGVTEEQLVEILNERCLDLLDDALNELQPSINKSQLVDFLNKDDIMQQFNFKLTSVEEDIVSDKMVVKYWEEEMSKLKSLQKYLGDDIKVFSPAQERRSFVEMLKFKMGLFATKLANYNTSDRLTGKFLV